MSNRIFALALVISLLAIACNNAESPNSGNNNSNRSKEDSQSIKEVYTSHEFFKNTKIEDFLKSQPEGSMDNIEISERSEYIIGVVNVFFPPDKRNTIQPKFETKYRTKDGEVITKSWTGAQGNKTGKYRAAFILPDNVTEGDTRIAE